MSDNIFECSMKHKLFNDCQKTLADANARIPKLASLFSDMVKSQDEDSMKVGLAALSRNNQHILNDIKRSDVTLEAIEDHYRDIPDADSVSYNVWRSGKDIKANFDHLRSQYEEGRDDMLQRAEHMKVSYDQISLLIKDKEELSAEDFDAVCQDLESSALEV